MAPEKITKQVISKVELFCRKNGIPLPNRHGIHSDVNFRDLVGQQLPTLLKFLSEEFSIKLTTDDINQIRTIRGLVNIILDKRRGNER